MPRGKDEEVTYLQGAYRTDQATAGSSGPARRGPLSLIVIRIARDEVGRTASARRVPIVLMEFEGPRRRSVEMRLLKEA